MVQFRLVRKNHIAIYSRKPIIQISYPSNQLTIDCSLRMFYKAIVLSEYINLFYEIHTTKPGRIHIMHDVSRMYYVAYHH